MTTSINVSNQECFAARAERIRKGLADSVNGPLRVASEVLAITSNWDVYKTEAGMSAAEWIRTLQHNVHSGYFEARSLAYKRLGAEARYWDHHAAVWLSQHPQCAENEENFRKVVAAVKAERNGNGSGAPPLSQRAVARVLASTLGTAPRAPRKHECAGCLERDATIGERNATIAALEEQLVTLRGVVQ